MSKKLLARFRKEVADFQELTSASQGLIINDKAWGRNGVNVEPQEGDWLNGALSGMSMAVHILSKLINDQPKKRNADNESGEVRGDEN